MSTIKIALHGAGGRMGRALVMALGHVDDLELVGATESPKSTMLGQDSGTLAGVGANGIIITEHLEEAFAAADVIIEFTRPNGTMRLLDTLQKAPRKLVTGTTGLDPSQQARLREYAQGQAVVQAANFSVGVNLAIRLTELAARVLDADADIEIVEAHHRDKVDAPSGTALRLGRAAAEATGRSLEGDAVYSRVGQTGVRPARAIGFATVRGGDIVGDHTVLFAGEGEQVEIRHRATSRANFASGALRAARWVHACPQGLHDMPEVLGLNA
ncbi:MAG: 4-hydroxy-tetrahydrodipicolinate reductase [Oceanococcaceae bacterium]